MKLLTLFWPNTPSKSYFQFLAFFRRVFIQSSHLKYQPAYNSQAWDFWFWSQFQQHIRYLLLSISKKPPWWYWILTSIPFHIFSPIFKILFRTFFENQGRVHIFWAKLGRKSLVSNFQKCPIFLMDYHKKGKVA